MELSEALKLINHKSILSKEKTTWADLGCGSGLFTIALANLFVPGSTIYAIDNNAAALQKVVSSTSVVIKKIKADFTNDDL
ncbi:MAG: methyltransferase domain-containing protein, partial [Chitinophagales bacterium]